MPDNARETLEQSKQAKLKGSGGKPVDALFTIREVADFLAVHPRTVARLIASGELAVIRLTARSVRISAPALRDLIYKAGRPLSLE